MSLLPELTAERLPCRGCMRDCPYFSVCDGKPWRMPVDRQVCLAGVGKDLLPAVLPGMGKSDHSEASGS